jgi:IS30 family transposase
VPKSITVDNGTESDFEEFRTFCSQVGTNIHFASVRHPESNGLVERINDIIWWELQNLWLDYQRESGKKSL